MRIFRVYSFLSVGKTFAFIIITICMATNGLRAAQQEYRNVETNGLKAAQREYRNVAKRNEEDAPNLLECFKPWDGSGGQVTLEPKPDRVVTQDMFQSFSDCEWLMLNNLNISDIINAAFATMPKLGNLNIENNHFVRVKRAMFKGVSSELDYLILSNNRISSIESRSFVDIKKLGHLGLSHNPLTGPITPETFMVQYVDKPSWANFGLDLSYTGVTIEPGLFQHIPDLTALYLNGITFK